MDDVFSMKKYTFTNINKIFCGSLDKNKFVSLVTILMSHSSDVFFRRSSMNDIRLTLLLYIGLNIMT